MVEGEPRINSIGADGLTESLATQLEGVNERTSREVYEEKKRDPNRDLNLAEFELVWKHLIENGA